MSDDMFRTRVLIMLTSIAFIFALYFTVAEAWIVRGWGHFIALGIAIALLIVLLKLAHNPHFGDLENRKPDPRPHSGEEIEGAAQYVRQRYSIESIAYFQNALCNLPKYLVRVDQEVELEGRELLNRTKLIFRNQQANMSMTANSEEKDSNSTLLIPVITARKGLLFDRLAVHGPDDRILPLISQYEVRGLLKLTVRTLFEQYIEEARQSESKTANEEAADSRLRSAVDKVVDGVIKHAVCFIGNTPTIATRYFQIRDKRKPALDSISRRLQNWSSVFDDQALEILTNICSVLTYNYVLVAEITTPNFKNFLISYEHQVTSDVTRSKFEGRLRARLGLDPVTLDVPAARAFQADSFHLQIKAPPGQYVFDHHLERLGSSEPVDQRTFSREFDIPPYVRLHHSSGRTLGHLYVRRQGSHPDPELGQSRLGQSGSNGDTPPATRFKSVIRFREVPPGSLAAISLLSLLTSALIVFFGIVAQESLRHDSQFQGGPALILSLPAFLAAGLGRGIDGKRIARASLTASIILWGIGVSSLGSVFLYVLGVAQKLGLDINVDLLTADGNQIMTNTWWLILSLWSVAITIFSYREKRGQTTYYLNLIKRAALDNERRNVENWGDGT